MGFSDEESLFTFGLDVAAVEHVFSDEHVAFCLRAGLILCNGEVKHVFSDEHVAFCLWAGLIFCNGEDTSCADWSVVSDAVRDTAVHVFFCFDFSSLDKFLVTLLVIKLLLFLLSFPLTGEDNKDRFDLLRLEVTLTLCLLTFIANCG